MVILRLLEHDVQASFTLKDSGNDLLAATAARIRAIQVKSTTTDRWKGLPKRLRKYHILALVKLVGEGTHLYLDKCKVFLLTKEEAELKASYTEEDLRGKELATRIRELFG